MNRGPVRRQLPVLALLVACRAFHPSPASAQTPAWTFDAGQERADISNSGADDTWTTSRLQTMWSQPGVGGWLLAVEHQRRWGLVDVAVLTSGYWHAGDWTFGLDAGFTPEAEFLPRAKAGGEVSYRAIGTLVSSGSYRYMRFASTDIHQAAPALTWYHARGEVEGRVYLTRNTVYERTSTTVVARSSYELTRRLRIGGGAAYGDRIFDVASLASGPAEARMAFADVRIGVTARDFVTTAFSVATEDPAFTYRSFTLTYRRAF